jgi:hypothetical protein
LDNLRHSSNNTTAMRLRPNRAGRTRTGEHQRMMLAPAKVGGWKRRKSHKP